MSKMTKTLAAAAAAGALMFSGAAPAAAAPTPVVSLPNVTVTAGMNAGAYSWWCNFFGVGCKHAKRWNKAGGYYYRDICSDRYCTKFGNAKAHPHVSKTTWSGVYRNY